MTVNALYDTAVKLGLASDDVDEVMQYIRLLGGQRTKEQCTCAACENRKTYKCPWPDQSKLLNPICFDFKKR